MKAYVCDSCGKVILLEEPFSTCRDMGMRVVYDAETSDRIELCQECFEKLKQAVRERGNDDG